MANKLALGFCESLFDAFGIYRLPEQTMNAYRSAISKWTMPADKWRTALDMIREDWTETKFPPIGAVFEYLRAACGKQPDKACWYWFTDAEGIRRVIKVKDPAKLPQLPLGATDARLQVPESMQARMGEQDMRERIDAATEKLAKQREM